ASYDRERRVAAVHERRNAPGSARNDVRRCDEEPVGRDDDPGPGAPTATPWDRQARDRWEQALGDPRDGCGVGVEGLGIAPCSGSPRGRSRVARPRQEPEGSGASHAGTVLAVPTRLHRPDLAIPTRVAKALGATLATRHARRAGRRAE